jgi:hypothetical protein
VAWACERRFSLFQFTLIIVPAEIDQLGDKRPGFIVTLIPIALVYFYWE